MTKRLTKEQRTERTCLYCSTVFFPKKGATKGLYCSKLCSSTANGYKSGRSNLGIDCDMNTPEEARIYYDESIDKGSYDF